MQIEVSFKTSMHERLDKILQDRFGKPRNQVQHWIKNGWVLVSGKKKDKAYMPLLNEIIEVYVPNREPDLIISHKTVKILYEDISLIVIDKPSGVSVHPGAGDSSDTIVGRLIWMGISLAPIGLPVRPGVVQRLDKETSGVMMLAKTEASYYKLRYMISNHLFERLYIGITDGISKEASGEITGYIARDPANRIRFKMIENKTASSKLSVTYYKMIESLGNYAIMRYRLETGRTHQIRVASRALGFPILSDKLYGKRSKLIERQALHSASLKFMHPDTGKMLKICANLPDDMLSVLNSLRRKR